MVSSLHNMVDGYASEYIIRRKQESLLEIQNKGRMHFCHDIILGHHIENIYKRPNYHTRGWNTSTPYDIFRNLTIYTTVCFLLYTWHRNDHCITVCGKCIFDSNFLSDVSTHTVLFKLYMLD